MVEIRVAVADDVEAITAIYNEAVLTTTASFDLEPRSIEDRREWFASRDENHPVLVADDEGTVVGWSGLSLFAGRAAYVGTAEFSFYVAEDQRRKGIGKRLLEATLEAGGKTQLRTVVARITAENEVSLRLHEQAGFVHAGVLRRVGVKFGKVLDVVFMQYFYDR